MVLGVYVIKFEKNTVTGKIYITINLTKWYGCKIFMELVITINNLRYAS